MSTNNVSQSIETSKFSYEDHEKFHDAISRGDLNTVIAYYDMGFDIKSNYIDHLCGLNIIRIPIITAVTPGKSANIEILKFLIEKNVDIAAKDDSGQTALHIAATYNNIEAFKLLTEYCKADINSQDNYGMTPLMIATRNNNIELVKFLIINGTNQDLVNCDGQKAKDFVNIEPYKYDTKQQISEKAQIKYLLDNHYPITLNQSKGFLGSLSDYIASFFPSNDADSSKTEINCMGLFEKPSNKVDDTADTQ